MKLILFAFTMLLVGCSQQVLVGGIDPDPPSWVRPDWARTLVEEYIAKRGFVGARLVEERGGGQFWRYRFATGDVVVAESVVLDRKSGKITFEHVSH